MLFRVAAKGNEEYYIIETKMITEPASGELKQALFVKPVTHLMKIIWQEMNGKSDSG